MSFWDDPLTYAERQVVCSVSGRWVEGVATRRTDTGLLTVEFLQGGYPLPAVPEKEVICIPKELGARAHLYTKSTSVPLALPADSDSDHEDADCETHDPLVALFVKACRDGASMPSLMSGHILVTDVAKEEDIASIRSFRSPSSKMGPSTVAEHPLTAADSTTQSVAQSIAKPGKASEYKSSMKVARSRAVEAAYKAPSPETLGRVTWYIQHRGEPIMTGWMAKRGAVHKAFRRRYFVLKFDRIEYRKKASSTSPRGRIVLEGATAELEFWDDQDSGILLVTSESQRRTFIIRGPKHEVMAWKLEIDNVLAARRDLWKVFNFASQPAPKPLGGRVLRAEKLS